MADSNDDSTAISVRNVEGESGKDDGASSRWPTLEEILSTHEEPAIFLPNWDRVFTISCAFAVFLDPFYPYIFNITEDWTCYYWDEKLMWAFIGLRSAADLFYYADIVWFYIRLRISPEAIGPWIRDLRMRELHKLLPLLPRIFVALPFPQVVLLTGKYTSFDNFIFLIFFAPAQYTLRVYRAYGLFKRAPNTETGIGRWLRAILGFLPFILAAHLYGALWYHLSLQRELDCWFYACLDATVGCDLSQTFYYFYCGTESYFDNVLLNITHIKASCPIIPPNATIFDFGIFLYALQCNLNSPNLGKKFVQCFWWGLRNLSSFGSNLQTSLYMLETFFTVLVSISGIVLFLIYLNSRVQISKQRSDQRKLRHKMHMMNPDIDLWLHKNGLSDKKLKEVIMKNLHQKLEEHKEVDVENILSLLPIIHQRRIMCRLSLNLLRNVAMLENMDEQVLIAICERLKPVIYTEDAYIIREGEPLDKMLFIMQGTAWSYTTSSNCNICGSTSGSSNIKCLERGDFYGEELMNWASKLTSLSEFPISTRFVKCQTKVEAFAIRAKDLKGVVTKFWWHFSKEFESSQLEQWESLAISSLRAIRCRRHARARARTG
ncbi:hypothetical protein L3X38_038046 [Prunus dulcis]|uniref:Cyclic nucleotide-binding domain-containing protein n=1 Tax=Prunus dulcis TaxID=3755 RepID=A0AAD4YRT3_PRUDU|nr:hypothetical protein L3X38_038046 [Prunus dulcis]